MPDSPHVPETNFMLAAQKAIKDLQETAEVQRLELNAAAALAQKAANDARWRKIQVRILGLVSVVLVVVCILGTVQYFHTRDIANKVQQGSVTQCMDGNHLRSQNAKIWDFVLDSLLVPSPGETEQQKAGTIVFVRETKNFISRVYAPQNCTALFGIPGANPPNIANPGAR